MSSDSAQKEKQLVNTSESEYWEKARQSLNQMPAIDAASEAQESSLESTLSEDEREKLKRKVEKYKRLAEIKQQVADSAEDIESADGYGIQTPVSLRDRFLFLRELGRGTQARVYLALRLSDQKHVAVKQLNISSVKNWKDYELFGREVKVLKSLDLEGVARFYEAVECLEDEPPCSYLVQEYIDGASMAKMLKDGHRFKVTDVYDILLQVLYILQRLQSQDPPVIHRDIKPSNLMISPNPDGSYKVTLIDFGAVANPQVQGGGSTLAGTFGYMPPEQLMGKPSPASDVYAVAAVAVQLFCGKSPADLPMKDFRIIFEPEMEQMPPALIHTLRKMLEPKLDDRLSDVGELIRIFEEFKNDNFRVSSIDAELSKDLNDKLHQVGGIGENGNMDLWQKLPDQAPRAIPELLNHREAFVSPEEAAAVVAISRMRKGSDLVKAGVTGAIGLALFLLFGLLILPLICWAFTLYYLLGFVIGKDPTLNNENMDFYSEYGQNRYQNNDDRIERKPVEFGLYQRILRDGRKTVATIVDVKYCCIQGKDVAEIKNVNITSAYNNREHHPYQYLARPVFRIQYKFNPPDDAKEEDLIHECLVHTEPEKHYAIGDPLPIIYLLDNGYFSSNVYSLPFPFPYHDSLIEELVCMEDMNVQKNTPVEQTLEYRNFFLPIMEAKDDNHKLVKMLDYIPLISDVRIGRLLMGVISEKIQDPDPEISSRVVALLCEAIHRTTNYRIIDRVTESNEIISLSPIAQLYTDYLYNYFMQKPRKLSYGAVNGLISYQSPSKLSPKIYEAAVDVFMDPGVDLSIYNILMQGTKSYGAYTRELEYARFPMSVVHHFFDNPRFSEYYPYMFLVWNGLFTHGFKDSYHEELEQYLHAAVDYFKRREKIDGILDMNVFDAVWYPIYLLEFPKWFWPELENIYDRSSKRMKMHITKYISTYYYLLMPIELKQKMEIRADR